MRRTTLFLVFSGVSGLTGWGLPVAYPNLDPWYGLAALYIAAGLAAFGVLLGLPEIITLLRRRRERMAPSYLQILGFVGIVLSAAIAFTGFVWQQNYKLNAPTNEVTASSAQTATAASLSLLMRPSQDPQELSKSNIFRWFVFTSNAVDPKSRQSVILSTYIFLVFDSPFGANYRRVFSPSDPNIRFEIIEITQRSSVIAIHGVDLSGKTVEMQFSNAPL